MRKPVTADVVNPATIVSAVANDNHTVFEIAAYLGVNHSSALLRSTLHDMVAGGLLVADDSETRRFTLPWESAPSLDDPHYESEMTLRAMQAIHLVVGPLNGVGIRAGGWIACDPNDARPSVPLTQRTRDQEKATCPDCLSASGDDNADSD